jgi:predicted nucleic acid-binding protein
LDTSVLVRALVEALPAHETARSYLDRSRSGEIDCAVSTHALAELYATLTALPSRPRHSPADAQKLVAGVRGIVEAISLSADDYASAIDRATSHQLTSGAMYDVLHVIAAEKRQAAELVTFDGSDFRRIPLHQPTELVVLPNA